MDETWTLTELVGETAARIAALPPPKNGQVRAVPDDRTIRYYGSIGLLDRPLAMRGRTALYGRRHLAQVVAIKRLQSTGRSLAEIQELWPTLDDVSLARMSGVEVTPTQRRTRSEFWKREPAASPEPIMPITSTIPSPTIPSPTIPPTPGGPHIPTAMPPIEGGAPRLGVIVPAAGFAPAVELRIQLAPGIALSIAVPDGIALNPADVHALRAAAAPLVELIDQLGQLEEGEKR